MFASISSSLMERFRFDSSISIGSSFQVRLASCVYTIHYYIDLSYFSKYSLYDHSFSEHSYQISTSMYFIIQFVFIVFVWIRKHRYRHLVEVHTKIDYIQIAYNRCRFTTVWNWLMGLQQMAVLYFVYIFRIGINSLVFTYYSLLLFLSLVNSMSNMS